MSQHTYAKKREDPEGVERAIKYWVINCFMFTSDIIEAIFHEQLFEADYFYCVYLLLKSGFFFILFSNNFKNAAGIYDSIVPKIVPIVQPQVDFVASKLSKGTGYFVTNITPGLAGIVAGQTKNVMSLMATKLVTMLEFKAAVTEPQKQQLSHQPEGDRMAMSMMANNKRELMGNKPNADVNATQVMNRNVNIDPVSPI